MVTMRARNGVDGRGGRLGPLDAANPSATRPMTATAAVIATETARRRRVAAGRPTAGRLGAVGGCSRGPGVEVRSVESLFVVACPIAERHPTEARPAPGGMPGSPSDAPPARRVSLLRGRDPARWPMWARLG